MRIDVPSNEVWQRLSASYRKELPFQDDKVQVQVYCGFQHALFEATQGLARLFSHKKTVAIVGGCLEPALEQTAIDFSEQTYNVIRVQREEISPEWLTPLQSDLLFILDVEDDPVTGRLYDQSKLLETSKEKKTFRISLSHAKHRFQALKRPGPYEVVILSLRPNIALLVAGERFSVSPQLAPRLAWDLEAHVEDLAPMAGNLAAVSVFEGALPKGFERYFSEGESRTPDRAVIFHRGLDGSAVMDELGRSFGISRQERSFYQQLDTTSPCRWNQPRFQEWLLRRGETEDVVRGLIVIASERVNEGLGKKLEMIGARLMQLQTGEA